VYDPANGGLQATPFLNMSSLVTFGGEQGLLSMAFHPNFKDNGYFFVYYNNTAKEITVARYSVSANANIANAGSHTVLLAIPKPFDNHNGGHLQFGKDGHLYFATGDGGSANDPNNLAQNPLSLLGKMIRINVDNFTTAPYYTVPSDNPFVGNAAYDSRIWALGLRNPFRWSFDRLTGDMWIGDVGQGEKEEINLRSSASTGGENYGWRCYEGSIRNLNVPPCDPPNHVPPVFEYDNPTGSSASVIGGCVYRGTEFPSLYGYYIASDVYTRTIYLVKPNGSGGWTVTSQPGSESFVVGFGEAEDGTLYAVSQGTNTVYKVAATGGTLPVVLQQFWAKPAAGGNELKWTTATEEANAKFLVEVGQDGRHFTTAGEVQAKGSAYGSSYSFVHATTVATPLYYRLQVVESNNTRRYSAVVKVDGKGQAVQVYPSVVRNGKVFISSSEPVEKVQVLSSTGSLVMEKRLARASSPVSLQLPALPKGLYFIRIYSREESQHKIIVE
jgi:glucose/arabinose dehydrogenase